MSPRHGSEVLAKVVEQARRLPALVAKRGRRQVAASVEAARLRAQEATTRIIERKP